MIHGAAESLDIFFGDANAAETRVYARLRSRTDPARHQLAGTLVGPYCRYSQTLPATIPFVDIGPGETPLAQAIVPDPCFWTPELPFLYRAKIEVRRGGSIVDVIERPFGIRPLGARGRRFYYEGKPWVLRGAYQEQAHANELGDFRAAAAAMFVDNPDDELCSAASEQGVLLLARVLGDAATTLETVERLARHAAVGFIVIGDKMPAHANLRRLAPNVVFVQQIDDFGHRASSWAHAGLCRLGRVDDRLEFLANTMLPVIAFRPEPATLSIAQRRALCDALQRDMAGLSEIAGYMV
jgi:hypothetical protein